MSWPKELPLTDAIKIRKMERKVAESWLKAQYPDMAEGIISEAVTISKPDTPPDQVGPVRVLPMKHPAEGHFIAAAWLLGASLGNLAVLTNTSRSNVFAIVNRRLDKTQRNLLRRGYNITYDSLQLLYKIFKSSLRTNPDMFSSMTAVEIAAFLEEDISVEQ